MEPERIMKLLAAVIPAEGSEEAGNGDNQAAKLVRMDQQANEVVAAFVNTAREQMVKGAEHFLGKLHDIIKYQSDELLLFRVLETLIRTQKLDETSLNEVLEELKSLRVKAMDTAKAAAAAAGASQTVKA